MAEHILNPDHASALVEYVRFLRRKREGCVSEVVAEFKELKEMRLFEDNYTKDDVEGLVDGLLALVKTTMKKDLQTSNHSSVLLLKQMFEQAEKANTTLTADLSSTEDRNLLRAVEQWEDGMSGSAAVPQLKARAATPKASGAPALPVIGQTQDPKLLASLEEQKDSNASLTDKFQKLQVQCTGFLKDNTSMRAEIEALKAENKTLSSSSSSSATSSAALQGQVARLESELAAARSAPAAHSGVDSLMEDLRSSQSQVSDLSEKLEAAKVEIEARIEKSKQFANMRQMLAKKNATVTALRDKLKAAGIPIDMDEPTAIDD